MHILRVLMLVAAASLAVAATVHAGALGGPFHTAAISEATIAVILVVGLAMTLGDLATARLATLVTQGIALAGASIGLFLAVRGIAPDSTAHIAFHVALIAMLLAGLIVAWRLPGSAPHPHEAAESARLTPERYR